MRGTAAIIAVMLPVAAVAQDGSVCLQSIYSPEMRIEVTEVRDIGQGMVQELSTGTRETSGSDRVAFQHCATGQYVSAVMATWDASGSALAPANPYDIMMLAMESPTAITLAEVVERMVAAGVDAELNTWDRETCGCAQFYPEARGDKSPWVAP
jgi:hypothetical protein